MEYSTNHGSFNYNWGQPEGQGQQGHQQNHNNQQHVHVPTNNVSAYQSSPGGSGTASPMSPPGGNTSNAALNYCANFLNEFQMVQQLQQVRGQIAARAYNTREHHQLDSSFGRETQPSFVLAGNADQPFETINPVQLQPMLGLPVQNLSQPPTQSFQGVSSKKRKPPQRKPAPPKRKRGRPRKQFKKEVETESEDEYSESESSNEEEGDSPADSYFQKDRPQAKIKKEAPLSVLAQKKNVKMAKAITTPPTTSTKPNNAMNSTNVGTSASGEGVKKKVYNCELPATCTICNKTLSSTAGLTRHLKEVHPDGQLKKVLKPRRPKVDPNFRRIPAPETMKMTPDQEEFLKVIIAEVTCTKCKIKFRSKHKLILHTKRHHSTDKRSETEGNIALCEFNCQICSSTFDKRSDLAKHFWLSHYNAKRGWFSSIFYPMRCPFCPKEKLFRQLGQFNLHISTHHHEETDFSIIGAKEKDTESWRVGKTDKKSNYCSQCNFVTTNLVGLAEHYATVHVIPDFSFCNICGILQMDQDSRVEHTLRFHPEMEIESTSEESLFTDSILLQDGDLQTCDTCDSCFSSTKFLSQHKSEDHPKIVDGVRGVEGVVDNLPCFYCGNISKRRADHEEHMKSAHPHLGPMYQYVREKNVYKCEYCKGYFGHVVKLRKHFYQVHRAQPPVNYDALDVAEQEISKLASELCQAVLDNPSIRNQNPKTAAVPVPADLGFIPEKIQEHDVPYEDPIIIRGKITRKVTFTCYICSETFRLGKELDHHQINHHPEKREEFSLICGVCHKKYSTINIRRQHIVRTHLSILQEKLKCDQCDKCFETKLERKKHVMIMHKEYCLLVPPPEIPKHAPVPEQPLQEWTCFVCKDKFQSQHLLFVHIENVHPENFEEGSRRVCGICNIKVSSKNVLARHVRIQHCQTWRRFKCPKCPANYPRSETLRNHVKSVHQGIVKEGRPDNYNKCCKYCGLTFPSEILTRRHVNTDHPEEALAERKKKTMQMTSYTTGSVGEFYCKICTFSYPSESKLIHHVVRVHDRDSKPCEFCWRDVNVYTYNKHISRSHPERYYTLHTTMKNPAIPNRLRQLPLSSVLNLISKVQHEEEPAGNMDKRERLEKHAKKNKASKPEKTPGEPSSSSENSSEDSGSDSPDSDSNSEASSSEKLKSKGSNDDEGGSGSDSDESLGLGLNFASDDESKHSEKSKEPKPKPALKKGRSNSSLHQSSAKSSGKTRLPKPTRKNTKTSEKLKAKDSNDDEGSSGSDSDESLGLGLNFASDDESKHSDKNEEPKSMSRKSRLNRNLTQASAKSSGKTRLSKPARKNTKSANRRKVAASKNPSKSKSWGLNFSSDESESEASVSEQSDSDISEKPQRKPLSRKLSNISAKTSWKKCPKTFNSIVVLTPLPVSLTQKKPRKAEKTTSKKRKEKSKSFGLGLNFSSDDFSDDLLQSSENEDNDNSTELTGRKQAVENRSQSQIKLNVDATPDNLKKVALKKSAGKTCKPRRSRVTKIKTEKSPSSMSPATNVSKNIADRDSGSCKDWQNFNVPKVKVEVEEEEWTSETEPCY